MDKAKYKEQVLKQLFSKRLTKARKEYREEVKGTVYETQIVNYRNNMFNPLDLKPHQITGVYTAEGSKTHSNKLDRLIRIMEDMQIATGHLTYILNFVEYPGEFNFIIFGEGRVNSERKDAVDTFIQSIKEDKLKFIKTLRLLSEVV